MSLHTMRLADQAPQAWKNGGGITRDLLAWPAAAGWQVRISVADVARNGPFSTYPGVARWFAVVQGAGVVLQFAERSCRLDSQSEPLAFDGAAAPGCDLIDGPTLDLNLLARHDAGSAHMERALDGQPWCSNAMLRAVFTAQATTLLIEGEPDCALPAMSLAYSTQAAGPPWALAPAPLAWWLSFTPHPP